MNFLQLHFFFWMGAYIYTEEPRFLITVAIVCVLMVIDLVFQSIAIQKRQAKLDELDKLFSEAVERHEKLCNSEDKSKTEN